MEKLIVHILPNWLDIPIKILVVIITISFATFIFAAIKENIKLGVISHLILIISMVISLTIGIFVAIISIMPEKKDSYTITKTDGTILVKSHSDWVDNTTYNIIGHREGYYYLENNQHKNGTIKLKDEDFEKITNQQ
jgi:uncharacterized membrane protein (UPF0182 family)